MFCLCYDHGSFPPNYSLYGRPTSVPYDVCDLPTPVVFLSIESIYGGL